MQKGLDALCCTPRTHVFWLMLAGSHLGRHQNPSTWPPLHVATPWGGLVFLSVRRLCSWQTE